MGRDHLISIDPLHRDARQKDLSPRLSKRRLDAWRQKVTIPDKSVHQSAVKLAGDLLRCRID